MAEAEVRHMLAERDVLLNMKAAKELEIWTEHEKHNVAEQREHNSSIGSGSFVSAQEEDPLDRLRLDSSGTSSRYLSFHFNQVAQTQNSHFPADQRVTEIRDPQPEPLARIK